MVVFPHPLSSDEDGLLAIGGDLSKDRLYLAYRMGIFPWYNQPPILWWYTHPRTVLRPEHIRISKSMRNILRRPWSITMDVAFDRVIKSCRNVLRSGQQGTWITDDIISAYSQLHHEHKAHSIEVWDNDHLIGGLYGIVCGRIFCGESMFAEKSNASKVALIWLTRFLVSRGCVLIDCQQDTEHMKKMGSQLVDKFKYWEILKTNMLYDDMKLSTSEFDAWKKHYIDDQLS